MGGYARGSTASDLEPNTSLVVAIDLGEWNDIHPLNKKELARRVVLQVKKKVYGHKDIVHSGPLCTSVSVEGGKIILSFKERMI